MILHWKLLQNLLRDSWQVRTLPERVMEWLLLFVPLDLFERLRVAEIILYLIFNLLGRHHLIEWRLRLRILFCPNAMTPVNFLNCSLIIYALGKGECSLRNSAWRVGTEETE